MDDSIRQHRCCLLRDAVEQMVRPDAGRRWHLITAGARTIPPNKIT